MQITPRLLFVVAGIAFAAIILWPGARGNAVAEARALVGPDRVVMFSAPWCGYCDRLRNDLDRARVAFEERDIEASSENHRAWRALGGRGVPLTLVDSEIVNGYAPDRVLNLAQTAP